MMFMENITTLIKWIDLGLSVLWADRNLGAKETSDKGNYYAWGELIPKNLYTEETYLYKEDFKINKYEVPTLDQYKELKTQCTWKWTNDYNGTGVAGIIVTSKINGNSIFFPAASCYYNGNLGYAGLNGYYWTSSLDTDDSDYVYGLNFGSDFVGWCGGYDHFCGRSVRLIKNK